MGRTLTRKEMTLCRALMTGENYDMLFLEYGPERAKEILMEPRIASFESECGDYWSLITSDKTGYLKQIP